MTNKEIKTPSLLDAMLPILALVIMMGSAVYLFADNSSYGPNQIALLLAMGLAAIIGMKNGYSWKTIEKGIVDGISMSLGACLILLAVGSSYWHMDASRNRAYAYLFRFRVA